MWASWLQSTRLVGQVAELWTLGIITRMDIPLQPLRIPSGWTVSFNNGLYEIDPDAKAIPTDKHLWFFKEDMLQLQHIHHNRVLDVGWYPPGDLERGEYGLHLHAGDWVTGRLLHEFRTRDRLALVAEIERLLLGEIEETV